VGIFPQGYQTEAVIRSLVALHYTGQSVVAQLSIKRRSTPQLRLPLPDFVPQGFQKQSACRLRFLLNTTHSVHSAIEFSEILLDTNFSYLEIRLCC
jgi:hypothetical protein